MFKDYYAILVISQSATLAEIKSAYRTQAMKWHPDKNTDNINEATEKFKEITAAYTVLSDSNERKWYDEHRESILRGKVVGGEDDEDEEDEDDINVWPYFNSNCYSGPENGPNGFYTVYADLFSRLREREVEYARFNRNYSSSGSTAETVGQSIPLFGDNNSTDDEVNTFYDHWRQFTSCLSFANADKYNTNDESFPRYMKR